jgi:tyrosyl-tRNA synthetase
MGRRPKERQIDTEQEWKKISRDDVLSWLRWHIELKTKAIDAIEKERDVLERALDLLVEE